MLETPEFSEEISKICLDCLKIQEYEHNGESTFKEAALKLVR